MFAIPDGLFTALKPLYFQAHYPTEAEQRRTCWIQFQYGALLRKLLPSVVSTGLGVLPSICRVRGGNLSAPAREL